MAAWLGLAGGEPSRLDLAGRGDAPPPLLRRLLLQRRPSSDGSSPILPPPLPLTLLHQEGLAGPAQPSHYHLLREPHGIRKVCLTVTPAATSVTSRYPRPLPRKPKNTVDAPHVADARVRVLALELLGLVNLVCAGDLHVRARAGAPPPCCEAMDTETRRRCVREQEICEEEDKGYFRQERGKVANTHYNSEFSPKKLCALHC